MRGSSVALTVSVPLEAAATLALPGVAGAVLDAVLTGRPAGWAVGGLAALLAVGAAASALAAAAGPACTAADTVALRGGLLRRVLWLRPFPSAVDALVVGERPGAGDLTARLVGAAADAGAARTARLGAATALVTSAGAVLGLGVLSPWLAAAFFAGVVPGVVLVRLFMRTAEDVFTRYQVAQSRLADRLSDAMAGVRTVHAAGAEQQEAARVLGVLPELGDAGRALWRAQRRTVGQATLLLAAVELAVLGTAGQLVAAGRLPAGAFAAAAGWAALGLGFFEQVEALVGVAHARAGSARVRQVEELPGPGPGGRELPDGPGELVFQSVVVRDAEGAVVFGPLELTVPGGATVAVVGRSGAGKSLLAALTGGLRLPDGGAVLVDGVPVAALSVAERRRAVGYAFDRPRLVGPTLDEALEGADPAALAAARADGFLARLPYGGRTPVSELRLSGGELQRLGLARLLAVGSRVVVLDDATSSLDMATEHQVDRALHDSTRGRTRLVVTHRAAVAARADLVVWLDGGRVRAVGPHPELLAEPDYRATLAGASVEPAPARP
ncbi:ABC transporter ATP-binding protein [Streptomyces sp. TLI_171]|uniref:ATP-binding cassette domain-containing protein n=1 Tax=Streptomyces sp. TLI_171 TaxID=1938859 RepID=UPI000C59A77C|nr:ABC transporter ATP-binding protein [Streptomyces sp. TLI_171]RKE18871.1 ATP-binding cassette subfamily B protein [Streptomyces sp. TLI_171]